MNIKSLRLALLLSAALPFALPAGAVATPAEVPPSEYDKAVRSYLDAASQQLTAVRSDVELMLKDAKDEAKERLEKLAPGFERCDRLLADLQKAGPADFDRIKSEFELIRNKVLKQLDAARKA